MINKIVTIEDERPAGKKGECFYCQEPIGKEHARECVITRHPSLDRENEMDRPNGWIQWKGTDACIDLYCKCGEQFHYDGDFMYHVKCPYCGQVYEVGGHVKLYPMDYEPEGTIEFETEKDRFN